jgi:ABC-type antimicrobial peptide transport system permease subunit
MVLRQIGGFLVVGLVPGLFLAWALGRAFESVLFGVTPTDWRLYVSMTALLALVALLGALAPTRRAMGTDPTKALRCG